MMIPDDEMRHELVSGLIVAEPQVRGRHDRVMRRFLKILDPFVTDAGLGEIFGAHGYLLKRDPDTVRGPDLSFVALERLADYDDTQFFRGAPDLAIEILSPSNRAGEIREKVADYLDAGARWVWVIDPEKRTATTYRALDAPHHISPEGMLEGEDVLPGFSVRVASLFEEI